MNNLNQGTANRSTDLTGKIEKRPGLNPAKALSRLIGAAWELHHMISELPEGRLRLPASVSGPLLADIDENLRNVVCHLGTLHSEVLREIAAREGCYLRKPKPSPGDTAAGAVLMLAYRVPKEGERGNVAWMTATDVVADLERRKLIPPDNAREFTPQRVGAAMRSIGFPRRNRYNEGARRYKYMVARMD